jgi:hypothetical protein
MSTKIILSPALELQPAPLFTPTPEPRMPLDWLVSGDVLDVLPAHAVRGGQYRRGHGSGNILQAARQITFLVFASNRSTTSVPTL